MSRIGYGLGRLALTLLTQLWPIWLFWLASYITSTLWKDLVLAPQPDHAAFSYLLLYRLWPAAGLAGPVFLMLAALGGERLGVGSRLMSFAGVFGVAIATGFAIWPEWKRLSPYYGQASLFDLVRAIDPGVIIAFLFGLVGFALGVRILRAPRLPGRSRSQGVTRAQSDNHGHADWLSIKAARALFPGPDPAYGGIVVGEAYRVDQDASVRSSRGFGSGAAPGAFDPQDRRTWGQGGSAPLLIDPCRTGPTHALVLAGSGAFKTTAIGVPTLLTWTASAVVLDPSREIGPMVAADRQSAFGHKVVTLDPSDPKGGSFNALDWIDITSPEAETNIEAVATWLVGEPARGARSGASDFFRDMGKSLIACLLADILWTKEGEKTLRRLRQVLVTPQMDLRKVLERIHAGSPSPLARDLAGTLMGLVDETFSGVYANANRETRWLSTKAYADLVSGRSFHSRELCDGRLTVFVQIPLKVLESTPGFGRIVIGALLNAAYEADGQIQGRILFLLDEVARLGPMGLIETARDAGRKYGITLILLYQSVGQLVGQWGREGARAWYDSTSWRLYAAVRDPETARELSQVCGEHGVLATSRGDSSGTSARGFSAGHSNSNRSENRSEIRRALIKPDELLQDTRADEAFVIVRGARPLRCGRAIYFRRPEMVARVTASRFHKPPAAERICQTR